MNKTKMNLPIILLLMLITGFIIYYIYLKPEHFTTTTPNSLSTLGNTVETTIPNIMPLSTCPSLAPTLPLAIISRYFGVGFNIQPVTSTTSNITNTNYYLIEHIPITTNGVSGGMYSISSDGTFTIKIKNNDDPSQWWSMKELTDSSDTSLYQVMIPNNLPNMALQYSNGSLSIRPYTPPGFEGQKWLKSYTIVTRGIPVINNSPASMFTTEFDPYSTSSSINTSNLSDSNSKQVTDVINAVKTGIQQYLLKTNNSQLNGQLSSSSLGNKSRPLNVNLNLGASSDSSNSNKEVSFFENVIGSTSDDDILSILDKYEAKSGDNNRLQTVYSSNDLQNQLDTTANGCKLLNLNDYTSNRVSTCNCKI